MRGPRARGRQSVLCLSGAALLTVVMLVFSHLPNDRVPAWILELGDDKARHLLAYAVWAALLLGGSKPWWSRRGQAVPGITFLAAGFAALDEWTQPWSGRTCSFWDFSASVLGALLGCAGILGSELLLNGFGQKNRGVPPRGRSESDQLTAARPCPRPSDHLPVS